MNYDKEIEQGRVVDCWTSEEGLDRLRAGAGAYVYFEDSWPHKIKVILPPKPLEIEGYWCDKKTKDSGCCISYHRCVANLNQEEQLDHGCRRVKLVEDKS